MSAWTGSHQKGLRRMQTGARPGNYTIGSPQSREAARASHAEQNDRWPAVLRLQPSRRRADADGVRTLHHRRSSELIRLFFLPRPWSWPWVSRDMLPARVSFQFLFRFRRISFLRHLRLKGVFGRITRLKLWSQLKATGAEHERRQPPQRMVLSDFDGNHHVHMIVLVAEQFP